MIHKTITIAALCAMLLAPCLMKAQEATHPKTNVVFLGDTDTALGGNDCSGEHGWTYWFCQTFAPKSAKSYAMTSATWTNNAITKANLSDMLSPISNDNVVFNQVGRFKDAYKAGTQPEPGLVIVSCGTYDALYESRRPEMYDKPVAKIFKTKLHDLMMKKAGEVTTLAESVRYCCEILRDAFPDSRIMLLTPPKHTSAAVNTRIKKVGDTIEECGKLLGITVIRQDDSECINSKDGVKVNGEAIAKAVAEKL